MPYNPDLAQRIRSVLNSRASLIEKKMFGGVGWIINGNMACGVQGDDLIVRVGEANNEAALARPYARPFTANKGKPMSGWVVVSYQGVIGDEDLREWVEQGFEFALSLPAKIKS